MALDHEIREYEDSWESEISKALTDKFGDKFKLTSTETLRVRGTAPREDIYDICKFIRDELHFEHCSIVMGIDMVDYMQVVYILDSYSTYKGEVIELTVDIPNDDPHVRTVSDLWGGANWHERETWELFGIVFDEHPNLERLLTPDTYEFYPFRKSYKLRGWN